MRPSPCIILAAVLGVATVLVIPVSAEPVSNEKTQNTTAAEIPLTPELSSHPAWNALGHYRPHAFSSQKTSLIDDSSFFLHPNGKNDPFAELRASVDGLFGTDTTRALHLRCRYPARYAWLSEVLERPFSFEDFSPCEDLVLWLKKFEGASFSLIYASAFLDNAASMFGHTFLRISRPGIEERAPLLATTISYSARTNETKGPIFAFKGLFGFYKGRFGILPYDVHVTRYGDIDDRDIWEYDLALSDAETNRIVLHLWELKQAYFDYYFIDENCSYHLLALIQAGKPEIDLTNPFRRYAIPIDTVREVIHNKGILENVRLRPSRSRIIHARKAELGSKELSLAEQLFKKDISLEQFSTVSVSPRDRRAILDLTYEAQIHAEQHGEKIVMPLSEFARSLLRERNQVPGQSQPPELDTALHRPDRGHKTRRAQVSFGQELARRYLEADFRLAYHDSLDPQTGFLRQSSLEFFKGALRYYPEQEHVAIEELLAVSMLSTPSRNEFLSPYSWGLEVKSKRRSFSRQNRSMVTESDLSAGVSYDLDTNVSLSLLGRVSLKFNPNFVNSSALEFGTHSVLAWYGGKKWHLLLEAQGGVHEFGTHETNYSFSLSHSLDLGSDLALVSSLRRAQEFGPGFSSISLGIRWYH